MRLGDLDDLKKRFIQWSCSGCAFRTSENPTEICCDDCYAKDIVKEVIDNAQTFDVTKNQAYDQGFITAMRLYSRPQGECKGGFQLTELRRWLTSQGYSEGTVDDKINEFTRFVEKIRGEEECMTNACYKKQDAKHCNTCLYYQQLTKIQEIGYCETKNYHVSANSDKCINYKEKQ